MTKAELQFRIDDGTQRSATLAAQEEEQERAEEVHVEAEAVANGEPPRIGERQTTPHERISQS